MIDIHSKGMSRKLTYIPGMWPYSYVGSSYKIWSWKKVN